MKIYIVLEGGENMEMLKIVLEMMLLELELQGISEERIIELKKVSITVADMIDQKTGVPAASGLVREMYATDTKYLKKRVKRVARMLIGYCNESADKSEKI